MDNDRRRSNVTDASNITEKPSVIATAAILGALRGLCVNTITAESLCQITRANKIVVENLATLNEKLLANYMMSSHRFDSFN